MTIKLAKELIALNSVTPNDAGCQQLIVSRPGLSGFTATHLKYNDVDNLWLQHGQGEPVLVLLGHTDVVPAGEVTEWQSDPYTPTIKDGYLYGRGAADMKGSLAAMVTAMERFVKAHPDHKGALALLLTSDEEGNAVDGTCKVVNYLQEQNIRINWCLVGEPTSHSSAGDTIKIGRRGSLNGTLKVHGIQGHVAYPELANNPIHTVVPALSELCNTIWDHGNEHFPPTGFQISNIRAGTGADNVIPGTIEVQFNFRYSTIFTEDELVNNVNAVLNRYQLSYEIEWRSPGQPFVTEGGQLLDAVRSSINEITGIEPVQSTDGGTSDGRFIAPGGAEVVELGPVNATIHKINECISTQDLETLSTIYERVLEKLLLQP